MLPDNPDDRARLFYLIVLGLGIASVFLIGPRQRLSKSVRDFAIWVLIFVMVIIGYGFRDTLRATLMPSSLVQVEGGATRLVRGSDGHFHATLLVNDQPVTFIVDTGASDIVLSARDAVRAGIDPDGLRFTGRARTANGLVATAPVRIGILRFGDRVDTDVRASVSAGSLDLSLLGMAYLDRFARIEISGDRMLLYE